MKDDLLAVTRAQLTNLGAVTRAIRAPSTPRIRQRALLNAGATVARQWFDVVRPALEKAGFHSDTIAGFSSRFEALLAVTRSQPMKTAYLSLLSDISGRYVPEIIHQIE